MTAKIMLSNPVISNVTLCILLFSGDKVEKLHKHFESSDVGLRFVLDRRNLTRRPPRL